MAARTKTLRLMALPDPGDRTLAIRANGSVWTAAQAHCEHVARSLADFPEKSARVAMQYVFDPLVQAPQCGERLSVYLTGSSSDDESFAALRLLLDQGPLPLIFPLKSAAPPAVNWKQFSAACDVVRRLTVVPSTLAAEFNALALSHYVQVCSFEPANRQDDSQLDKVLDRLDEPVMIEIAAEPCEVTPLLVAHTNYLARLKDINRTWGADEEGDGTSTWTLGEWAGWVERLKRHDPLCEDISRAQQRFHETLTKRHLRFHIRVLARTRAVARLLASTVAENAFAGGSYQLLDAVRGEPFFEQALRAHQNLGIAVPPVLERIEGGRLHQLCSALSPLSNVAPTDELTGAFRLPIAGHDALRCIRKHTDPPDEDPAEMIVLGFDASFVQEDAASGAAGPPRGISRRALPHHAVILGMSGKGKSTCSHGILVQADRHGIPFIVLESGFKSEYRALKCLAQHTNPELRRFGEKLQIYTPGSEISPLRFNPLELPKGVLKDQHIDNLVACFTAAFPMHGSMPGILGEALEHLYWESEIKGSKPRLADLIGVVRAVLASKGYSGDVDSDFRALFDVRLGTLTRRGIGRVFQCRESTPTIDQLLTAQSVIELSSLPADQACLLAFFLLTAIWERVRTMPWSGSGTRFLVLLEEAHNIVGCNTDATASEDNADPKTHASALVCGMLAELRALGVAIIVLDQLPTAIAPAVLKNTATKLAFREVYDEDREGLGGAMLFTDLEMEEIARLRRGEAFLHTEGYHRPRRIRTPNLHDQWKLPPPPMGDAILPFLQADPLFLDAAGRRISIELEQLREAMDAFDAQCDATAKRACKLLSEHPAVLRDPRPKRRAARLATLVRTARDLRNKLQAKSTEFRREVFAPLLGGDEAVSRCTVDLQAIRRQLRDRFEIASIPAVTACLTVLGRLASAGGETESCLDGD